MERILIRVNYLFFHSGAPVEFRICKQEEIRKRSSRCDFMFLAFLNSLNKNFEWFLTKMMVAHTFSDITLRKSHITLLRRMLGR